MIEYSTVKSLNNKVYISLPKDLIAIVATSFI